MDLSKGRFIDDAEETILVNDKVVNGYASDNADIAKIRYNNLNADDKKAQQTKDAVGFLDMMMGAINSAADWVSEETEVPDVLKPAGDIAGRAIEGTSRGVARLGASMFYGQQKLLAEQTLKPKRKAGAGLLSDIAFGVGQALRDATGEEPVSTSSVAEQSLRDTIKEIDKEERQVQNAISEVLGTDESTLGQFSEGFGGGVASLLLTKLNYILAYYGFMLPTYSNIMSSAAKNENINMFGAGAVSTIAGIFNAAMEKWGAQQILEPIKVRNVGTSAIKNFFTEGITEYSQEWEELLPLLFYTKDEEFRDESGNIDWGKVNKQTLMAGGIGGFSGALLGMYSAGRVLDKSKRRKTIPYEDVSNIMKTRQVGEGGGEGPGGEPPSAGASKIRNEGEKPVDAIGKLIERGYTEEQAEQIIAALEDKSLITDELKKLAPGIDKAADAVEYMKQELTNKEYVAERLAKGLNTLLDPASFPGGSIDGLKNELRELKPYLDEEAAKIAKAEAAKTNVRDLVKIEGNFREEQKKAMEDTYQAAMEAGARELGVTPREYASPLTIATLAGENTQEVLDRLNSGEMTEEEQRMTYSSMAVANKEEMVVGDTTFYPDGTYDDGENLYAPDGTILFEDEQLDMQRENKRLDDIYPAYEGETIDINGTQHTVYNSTGERIAKSAEALQNFYKWFGDSKAVDKDGRPVVVYHGSKEQFDEFSKDKIGTGGGSVYGRGFYFTNNLEGAKEFAGGPVTKTGGYIYPVYLKIDNMYEGKKTTLRQFPEEYDGKHIVFGDTKGTEWYIVREPTQIKATDNRGTYSQETGNMFLQTEKPQENIYNATNSEGQPVANVQNFNRFIEGSHVTENDDVVSENNPPKKLYRGDTRYFETYEPQKYSYEYNFGSGFYLSDDLGDVATNYQSGGPDLTNLIDWEAETVADEEEISYEEARRKVADKYEKEDIIREFYVSMKNPVIIGGDKETFFELEYGTDSEGEIDYDSGATGTGQELLDAIQYYLADIGATQHTQDILDDLYNEMIDGGISASKLEDIIRRSDDANNLIDYESSPGEMLRQVFERMGYDGIIDHRAGTKFKNMNIGSDTTHYIVFNSEQAKSVDNKGEWSQDKNFYLEEAEGKPLGFADIQEQAVSLVGLLKGRNITTLPHEMTHFFTNLHVLNCIKFGKYDSIQKVMEYFDVTDPRQLIENRDIQERLARMGVRYVMENEAPTAGLRRYFEMFKRFGRKLVSSWKSRGLINEEELPEDIRDFFDSLLGKKLTEKVNIERIQEQSSDIVNAIKKIRSGQQVDINGLPINETRKLMKEASIRIPRNPQNLRTALINAGGINTEFAKNFDLQQLSGQEKDYRLFNRNGMIDSEDSLIDFLVSEGFMERGMEETYDDRSEQWDRAMELIENMEESYREQDQERLLERERAMAVSDEANRIINAVGAEDAFEVIELIDSLKGRTVVEKEYLDSLERRIKQLDKDYKRLTDELLKNQAQEFAAREKEATTNAKEELKQYRDDVVDFIRAQDLELKDKAKLIAVIKQANTKATFDKVIKEVERRSRELYRKEQVKTLSDMIQKEVSTRKPPLKNQKYDYENNKLFNDLREWNKFTQEKAENLLNEFMNDQEFMDNLNFEDEIRLRFLQHKALGAKSSPQLLQQLVDDIQYAKRSGIEARSEEEYNKAMSKSDIQNEMLDEIEKRKGKPTIYVKWVSNLYSSLYTIFGKNVADRFQLETVQNRAQIRAASHMANAINDVKNAYKIKSKGDFLKLISQLSTQNAEITTVREDIDTPLSKRGITHKLSTLDIIDIYNAIKNEKTRDDYYYWYGKQQIDDLLARLTPNEMLFGDIMQKSVNARYDDVNAAYVRNFYIDLPKVDNYWMATSEHKEDLTILDMYKNYKSQTPSFVKERTKSRTLPKPGNAWQKYSKHIQGTYWLTDMADKYTELANILKSVRVRNAIENKLGKGVYKALQDQVEMASYSGLMNNVDFVTGVVDSIINNVTVAKIALAVPVLSGQLSSVVLYAENMGMTKWSAGFLAGLSHPRQTYKFMQDNVGEFLKNRFQGGYDETINMILKEAEEGKKKYLLGAKGKYNLMNALTSFVRTGDVGAIIYGGYPRLKELLATMPKEKAIEQWEFETLRGQQSGVTVSKSTFQQQKGFARLFTAFRNFQYQANRKIVDSVYGYLNGDMTAAQAGKTIALYAGASAATYAAFKLAANALLFGWDKLDELEDEILMTIATQELSIIPGLDSVINYAIRRAMGKKAFPSPNILVINDLFNSVNKSMKKEKTAYDYAEIVAPFFEMFMAVPVSRMTQTVKKIAKPTEEKPKKKVAKKK